ncbi:MAG: homoserine dehydrogenase [Firmicutes bacterium]|nr:homoserine dehydrogenase [Bacillota bacterium]
MSEKVIKLGLLGLGVVGSGTIEILRNNREQITNQLGASLEVSKVLVRDVAKARSVSVEGLQLTQDPNDILEDPEIDIVVEVMGGVEMARQYITQALKNKKHVVTANKDLMAQHGTELLQLAEETKSGLYYEASVGGGIPIIRPLKHSLSANEIQSVMGIINGTTNYILTQMSVGKKEFADALKEAQEKGFAEQDPSSDLQGRDAAYKLAILSRLAFHGNVSVDQIYTESIENITLRDIQYAEDLGYVIKLLAIAEKNNGSLALRVHPTLVHKYHPLASVSNEFNAIWVNGDAVGEVMFYGRGAGSLPTGSAIVSDIIGIARRIINGVENNVIEAWSRDLDVLPMTELKSRFYVRIQAIEQPGVFAALATAFADEEISLDRILQKFGDDNVPEIVLITHHVKEANFYRALNRINALPSIQEISNVIRVLERS